MQTPTQRTLAWLRQDGWTAAVVERWNAHTKQRQDLFGFADIIAFRADQVLLVQATSDSNLASRVTKCQGNKTAREWMAAGNALWCVGWRKRPWKRKDGRKAARGRWTPRVVDLRQCD